MRRVALFAAILTCLGAMPRVMAGSLDAPGAPAAGSGMPTTADIYNRLDTGAAIVVPGAFQEPASGPASSGRTLAEIRAKLPVPDNANGATASEVAAGKTFWGLRTDGSWGLSSGAMAAGANVTGGNGVLTFPIPDGFYSGSKTATATDGNLLAGNIKSGVTIFGITGTAGQASGTAVAADVLSGKTFSNSGASGVNGTMADNGALNITPGTTAQPIPAGYHNGSGSVAGDANLVAGNIRSGTTIFGVSGTLTALDMSHVATLICASHWTGATCNICAGMWSGANCDACPAGWLGSNCDIIARPFPSTLPDYAGTPWKCVHDDATGLTWEVKNTAAGLHDSSNTYTWYSSTDFDPISGINYGTENGGTCNGSGCDTEKFVAAANAEQLCGYGDWRLPSASELTALISGTVSGPPSSWVPLIDNAYYRNSLRAYYWSGSIDPADPTYLYALVGDFAYGTTTKDFKNVAHPVRLVRGP